MFGNKSFSGNPDSDQSISDEDEEIDPAWPKNFVSLAGTSDHKKKSMGIASQLELLKGVHQNDVGFSSDDEVEQPDFDEKRNLDSPVMAVGQATSLERDYSTYEIDDRLSSDEGSKMLFNSVIHGCTVSETLDRYARGKQKQFEPCTWSAAHKDDRTIDKYSTMGGWPMTKARSSSCHQWQKKGTFLPSAQQCNDHDSSVDDDLLDDPETTGYHWPMDKSISELVECSDGTQISESNLGKQIAESNLASPVQADIQHAHSRYSMVELLDDLRGGRSKGRTRQHTVIRSASSSGKDIIGDEDPCEVMHSGSSTDDEDKVQNPERAVMESKGKTMADKFEEAFGSSVDDMRSSFTVLNQSSNGLFGRLQRVLQSQKERSTEFFKNLQIDVWPRGKASCLDVKILSRSYDAKLIVCQCSLLENEESSLENPHLKSFGKIWTVIFSPRVCGDVDLELANLIRIHPPWKEVKILRGGEIIILATYYSQICT